MAIRIRIVLFATAATVALGGCRSAPDPAIDILEGELRWMEDQLYLMEDELKEKCDLLADCRTAGSDCDCQPQDKRPAGSLFEPIPARESTDSPRPPKPASRRPRATQPKENDAPELKEPTIELPSSGSPSSGSQPSQTLPSLPQPSSTQPSSTQPSSTQPPSTQPSSTTMPPLPAMPRLPSRSSRSKPILEQSKSLRLEEADRDAVDNGGEDYEQIPGLEIKLQSYTTDEPNGDNYLADNSAASSSQWEVLPLDPSGTVAATGGRQSSSHPASSPRAPRPLNRTDDDDWEILPLEDWEIVPLDDDPAPRLDVQSESDEGSPQSPERNQATTGFASTDAANESPVMDAHVTHVVANCYLNGDQDFDNGEMEPGVLMTIQPRNADGKYVALAAPISVAVLDSQKTGSEARIARWDIPAEDAQRTIRQSAFGHGIHLALAWEKPPQDLTHLHVFVRYETVDGRKLVTDLPVLAKPDKVQLSTTGTGTWTPASLKKIENRGTNARTVSHPQAVADSPERTDAGKMPHIQSTFETRPIDRTLKRPSDPARGPDSQPRIRQANGRRPEWQPYR